ncbi:MAG: valine--tRNA ligase [Desulfobacterales bacterium]|nr:valine--tRNA ligase [Desulfobacterales bacterium]
MSNNFDKAYEPQEIEKNWYDFWLKEGLFTPNEENNETSYSIVIPPPNVTGVLHMGHALNVTLQDVLCRYRRLKGDNVLWVPGTDHAGIATQNVVEKKLASDGLDRHKLGREKFVQAVWEWREKYGSAIISQLKRMGASCDWTKERFTMDAGLSVAVRKVFVDLYHQGLIYRGKYIINWCPRCQTALADLEVEHEECSGRLYHIKYPFINGKGAITIATTRPETMLGDTGVAVNPNDERYQNISVTEVILPLVNRKIPIIKDSYVDMSFGTGALKVTPAHDPHDFEIGIRHNLAAIKVIGDNGIMTNEAGRFVGLERFKCRELLVRILDEEGLLEKVEDYNHSIGHCYRCKNIIEPNLSLQWFVKTKPLAQKAIHAVKKGDTQIIPDMWAKTYFDWLENIKDWCISRQIWWGHQIPAWTCAKCENMVVEMEPPKKCPLCESDNITQETDVLDTWFSSALWPFSTMGWPIDTNLLKTFYPTSVLVTGFDILFFWVARMMMMGLHFMGNVPFKDVYVHALVRDEEGKKMSKSKGNVIDPITIIEKYGTDAFRFTLSAFAAQGRDIKMSEKRVEGYKHFINKLWNASRFALMHINKGYDEIKIDNLSLPDKWIVSRMVNVINSVSEALDEYRFNDAASSLYTFVWHELCDWYLEAVKPILYGKKGEIDKESTSSVLWYVLHDTLIMLHPFIPFVTEEIWHNLPGAQNSIMKAKYPNDFMYKKIANDESQTRMETLMSVISCVRNIRGEMNISPSLSLDIMVQCQEVLKRANIKQYEDIIINLAKVKSISVTPPSERPKSAATSVVNGTTVFVYLEGIIDFNKEIKRLEKEIDKINSELTTHAKKLANEDFLIKAPPEVVEKVKEKHNELIEKKEKLEANLDKIREIEKS